MAVASYIEEEGPGKGRGHVEHGNGKGLGHQKHAEDAMSDGVYTMDISGISHSNHTPANSVTAPVTLADGSQLNTEVRDGEIRTVAGPAGGDGNGALFLDTDSGNGRLRVNDVFSADQQFKLGDLEHLSFNYYVDSSDRTDVIPSSGS